MKKTLIIAGAALLICGAANAQDLAKATELAKQANEALVGGDAKTALASFKAACQEAAQCAEAEAAELVANCKKGIVQSYYKVTNDLAKEDPVAALAQIPETIASAKENGEGEIAEKCADLKLQLHQAVANAKVKAASIEKDVAAKAALFKEAAANIDEVVANDPTNGGALLLKGQIMSALGDKTSAIDSFLKAKENGKEEAANKQLSTIYVKEAQALLKSAKLKEAVDAALKSNEFLENANAYKIAGIASQKLKDLKSAKQYLSKYLELNPKAADAAQIKAAVDAIAAQIK